MSTSDKLPDFADLECVTRGHRDYATAKPVYDLGRKIQAAIPNASAEMAIEAMTTGKHFFEPDPRIGNEWQCTVCCEVEGEPGAHFSNPDGTSMAKE